MEVGYIRNGEMVEGYHAKAKEFDLTVTADEAGTYYFYAINSAAGYIIIASGTIE